MIDEDMRNKQLLILWNVQILQLFSVNVIIHSLKIKVDNQMKLLLRFFIKCKYFASFINVCIDKKIILFCEIVTLTWNFVNKYSKLYRYNEHILEMHFIVHHKSVRKMNPLTGKECIMTVIVCFFVWHNNDSISISSREIFLSPNPFTCIYVLYFMFVLVRTSVI